MKNIILNIARIVLKFDYIIIPVIMCILNIVLGANIFIALGVALFVFAAYASGMVHKFMANFLNIDIYEIVAEIEAELKK